MAESFPDPANAPEALPARKLVRDNGPMYRQLAAMLRESIVTGAYPVDSALPKEAEIAEHFGVSLITVRQALRDLEADGLIRKRPAKPAVVARPDDRRSSFAFRTFTDVAAFTRNAALAVRSYRRERSLLANAYFGLGRNEPVYTLRGLLVADGVPEATIVSFFPPELGRRLSRDSFDDVLIFRTVERRLGIQLTAAEVTVRAQTAEPELAVDLAVKVGSAVLAMEMRYRSAGGDPVELTIARHRADLFSLTYEIRNDHPG